MSHPHAEQLFSRDRHPESRDITMNPETAPGMNPPATQLKASALGEEESAVMQQKESEQRQHAEKPGQNPPPFTPPAEPPMNPDSNGAGAGGSTGLMAKMEACFGTSFGDVKLNTNSQEAQAIQAKAFARGNEVHFAPGQFNPETQGGQELMGHELAHIVQQRQGRVTANATHAKGLAVNDDRGLENEADQMGRLAASGKSVSAHMRGAKAGAGANVTQGAFTSSVSLSRKLKEGEEEKKVGSDQVRVTGLQIPEKKRQKTRHGGNKQGHHSLAWTFLVKSYQQLANKKLPVQTLLEDYLIPDYEDLKKQMTYGDINVDIDLGLLDEMKKGSRTPSEWRGLVANLMQNYMRIHQLAPFATATKTFSKPGGEGKIKSSLEEYSSMKVQEMNEEENEEVVSVDMVLGKMSGALEDLHMLLVDPLFQTNPAKALQFLKKEWINTMKRAYPDLWEKMENAVDDLETTIDSFFLNQYVLGPMKEFANISMATKEYENGNSTAHILPDFSPPKNLNDTVNEAIKGFGENIFTEEEEQKLKKISPMKFITTPISNIIKWVNDIYQDQMKEANPVLSEKKEDKKTEEVSVNEKDFFKDLSTEFNVTVNLREDNGIKSPMSAYTMNQLNMSNDRPDTQYGAIQKSHTVAWTLIRESYETLGQGGQPLEEFFTTLQEDALKLLDALSGVDALVKDASSQKGMDKDVKTPLKEVAQAVQQLLKGKDSILKTDGEWEQETSDLLTKYVVAMHHSPTTTMGKKPGGRGEAAAKGRLCDVESTIYDLVNKTYEGKKPTEPKWKDIQGELKTMLDLEKGKLSANLKGKPYVFIAYEWEVHIKRAFPMIYEKFKAEVQEMSKVLSNAADKIEGYDKGEDYLKELRDGSKVEGYKKKYLPKEEKKEIEIEESKSLSKFEDLSSIFSSNEIDMKDSEEIVKNENEKNELDDEEGIELDEDYSENMKFTTVNDYEEEFIEEEKKEKPKKTFDDLLNDNGTGIELSSKSSIKKSKVEKTPIESSQLSIMDLSSSGENVPFKIKKRIIKKNKPTFSKKGYSNNFPKDENDKGSPNSNLTK